MALTVLLGTLAGWWADAHWGTQPAFTLTGAVLGIGLALYGFVRTVTARKQK